LQAAQPTRPHATAGSDNEFVEKVERALFPYKSFEPKPDFSCIQACATTHPDQANLGGPFPEIPCPDGFGWDFHKTADRAGLIYSLTFNAVLRFSDIRTTG
jgi:hypothetical protein